MGWTLWTETDTSCTPIQPVCRCQGLGVLQFPFHKHYHEHSNRHSGGVTLVQAWKLKFGKINFFEYILNHYIKKAYTLIFLQKENRKCNLLHSAKIAKNHFWLTPEISRYFHNTSILKLYIYNKVFLLWVNPSLLATTSTSTSTLCEQHGIVIAAFSLSQRIDL